MSIRCSDRVWATTRHKGNDMLVLLAIARRANDDGGGAWPSVATLAKDTRLSIRSVQRALKVLAASGELGIEAQAGPHRSNSYTIYIGREGCQNVMVGGDNLSSEGDNGDAGRVTVLSPESSVLTVQESTGDGEARARTKKIDGPILKAHSARRPAHPPPDLPKEGAPTADPPPQDDSEGLADGADIEALLADSVLLVAAGAWLSLQGRGLETLTAAECETLSRSRAAWGKRFSPDDIRLALDKTTLRKAQVPHVYFVGLLDEWAKQPANSHARARAAPNGHNGNGHARVHGPEWNGVENGHIVDGAAYHAYHERLAEVRVVKSGGG